jgi:hypothetical protein
MAQQPTSSQVHVDQPLTQISIAFLQDARNFVADQVFPKIGVSKQSDRYYTYDRGEFNRDEMALRAPGTESAGSGYSIDNTPTYYCPVYAMHRDIDDQVRANADSVLSLDREAAEYLSHKALIKKEKLWVSKFFAGGLWTGGDLDGVAATPGAGEMLQWNDASSTPIEDVRAGATAILQSTGMMPNTLVLGHEVFAALLDHPDIIDRLKYGQTPGSPAMAGRDSLAALFGVERLFVMRSIENTAAEGASADHAFIGGKKALLCYSAPQPGLMTPSAGYTFQWTGMAGGGEGVRVKRMRMEHLESDRVELQMAFDQKLIASDLGYFWDTAVA